MKISQRTNKARTKQFGALATVLALAVFSKSNAAQAANTEACAAEAGAKSSLTYRWAETGSTKMAEVLAGSCSAANPLACVMAQGALLQAKQLAKAATDAQESAESNGVGVTKLAPDPNISKWAAVQSQLNSAGVTAVGQTAAQIGGRTLAFNSVSDFGKVTSAGFTKDEFDLGQSALGGAQSAVSKDLAGITLACDGTTIARQMNKNLPPNKVVNTTTTVTSTMTSSVNAGSTASSFRAPAARTAPNVEGMFVMFEGTPIGVAQDNLFKMASRRIRAATVIGFAK